MDAAIGGLLINAVKTLHEMLKTNKDPKTTMAQVLEIQVQVYELVGENQALKNENVALKAQLSQKEAVELKVDGAIWRKTDKPTEGFGGFCPNCYDDKGKLLKLEISASDYHRSCSVCKFYTSGTKWY